MERIDTLQHEISRLVADRQALRAGGATPDTLERNRREITRAQWELAHALIAAHAPGQTAVSAA